MRLVPFIQDHYFVLRAAVLKVNQEVGPIRGPSQALLHRAPDTQQKLQERDLVSFAPPLGEGGGGSAPTQPL